MVKVTCEIETKGEKATPSIRVHNHWNYDTLVEIEIDGKRYTVAGEDMKVAIDNCMNTKRF